MLLEALDPGIPLVDTVKLRTNLSVCNELAC